MTTGETRTHAGGTHRPGPVAGLSRPALRRGLFRRPTRWHLVGQLGGAGRLRPVAGHLLHVVDLLRRGWPRPDRRLRLRPDLHRPPPADRPRLPDPAQKGPAGPATQTDLERRLAG